MPAAPLPHSKTRVNRAGQRIREYLLSDLAMAPIELQDDMAVVRDFRAAHQLPLTKATMGLRSMVRTEGCRLEVSQRLKRFSTIIDKLVRQPDMALARMQDVGGCRAVLDSVAEVYAVQRRIRRNGRERRVVDYIDSPAPSGYRGVHVIVEYDHRLIEVQLRTRVQHQWAVTVERLGGRLNEDLKSGFGPPAVLELLQVISRAMALEERGEVVDEQLTRELGTLRAAAEPFLAPGGR